MSARASIEAARTWFDLVLAYDHQSGCRRDIATRTEALKRDPDSSEDRMIRGDLYLHLGQAWRAMADYDRALGAGSAASNVELSTYCNRAAAAGLLGDHPCAIAALTDALRLAPGAASCLYARGLAHQLAGDHEAAIADYDEAIAADGNFALSFYNRASASAALGRSDLHARDLARACAINGELADPDRLADDLRSLVPWSHDAPGGDDATTTMLYVFHARDFVSRCGSVRNALHPPRHAAQPPRPSARSPVAIESSEMFHHQARATAYRHNRAAVDFRDGRRSPGPSWSKPFENGVQHGSTGDCAEAVRHLTASLGDRPDHAAAHLARGLAHLYLGDRKAAVADYDQATSLDPLFIPIVFGRALVGGDLVGPVGRGGQVAAKPVPARPLPKRAPPKDGPPGSAVRVFIDTSSLMERGCDRFFDAWLRPVADQPDAKILVPATVMDELTNHTSRGDRRKRDAAQAAIRLVEQGVSAGWLLVARDDDDKFPDHVFNTLFNRFRIEHDLCLVTQDRDLAQEILALRASRSVRSRKEISAFRIRNGDAENWSDVIGRADRPGPSPLIPRPPASRGFQIVEGPVQLDMAPLPTIGDIRVGMYVFTANRARKVRLDKRVARGGEGTIFAADDASACKVYDVRPPTVATRAKLELMCAERIEHRSVCWPKDIMHNRFDGFVGYSMAFAAGHTLGDVIRPPDLARAFPGWNRTHLATLTLTILNAIDVVNRAGVLLGDINPNNIVIGDERTIRLVDTDSYQVDRFPCTVYMPPFLHPELVGKDLRTTMRTQRHENFAVATLIFRILMLSQSPYAHRGGSSPEENVVKGKFPYPGTDRRSGGVPQGGWGKIWSYFPTSLRDAFHAVFSDHDEVAVSDWIRHLNGYRSFLQRHDDPQASLLVPEGYRRHWAPGARLPDDQVVRTCANESCERPQFAERKDASGAAALLCTDCRVKQAEGQCEYPGCDVSVRVRLSDYFTILRRELRCNEHWPSRRRT